MVVEPSVLRQSYFQRVALWPEPLRHEARTRITEAALDVQCCTRDREVWPIVQDLERLLSELEAQSLTA
jgi:hypothetical protein